MKLHYHLFHLTISCVARLIFRWKIVGRENIPEEGGLIASNHISVLDPPLIGSAVPGNVFYFAKQELFRSRLIGAFLRSVNAFPAKRGQADRAAWKTAKSLLTSGKLLLFFPEGTRSADGMLQPAQPGMARLAFGTGVPVVPAAVVGSNRMKDALLRRAKLRVGFASPVYVSEFDGSDDGRYQRLTERVMKEIGDLMDRIQQV